jgi:Catechol dioxygenase N terminus
VARSVIDSHLGWFALLRSLSVTKRGVPASSTLTISARVGSQSQLSLPITLSRNSGLELGVVDYLILRHSTLTRTIASMPSAAASIPKSSGIKEPRFDPRFTQNVIDATGPKATPRMRQVMASLIRHVHDFARENEITVDEWMQGVELLNWAGKMSDDKRNEGQLVCDVIGLES